MIKVALALAMAFAVTSALPEPAHCRDCTRRACYRECPGACVCMKRDGEPRGECVWIQGRTSP